MKKSIRFYLNIYLLPIFIFICAGFYFISRDSTELEQFRCSSDPLPQNLQELPSYKGLDELRASGSSRITPSSLKKALADIAIPVYIFDLQVENHYFIESLPLHWFGYGRSTPPFSKKSQEASLFYLLRRFLRTGKLIHTEKDIQSEKEVIEQIGFSYIDAHQTRHRIPHEEQVDLFIKALSKLPSKCWIHFHCSAGKGRTTVALVMYDILKNRTLPLKDIIERQYFLGGENLFDTSVWKNGSYTQKMLEARKKFIHKFYLYVHDPKGLGFASWKEWIKTDRHEIKSIKKQ